MRTVSDTEGSVEQPPLLVHGSRFFDPEGRHVLLHGINVVNKDPRAGYLFDEGPELYARMREWGFNVIRLGMIWDGLEPEPGHFDEAYLKRLDRQIAWAAAHGLLVFLDMHQDLYSVLFSDGAPTWATLTGGAPHIDLGGVWSDAYFTSPAVQAALDAFWNNAPAPDGLGIQEHYALAWAHVAQRYAHEPAVIGFDLMNEPFPGSAAVQTQAMMFIKGAELTAALGTSPSGGANTDVQPSAPAESLAEQWLTPGGRSAILELLRDVGLYMQVIDATQSLYAGFETSRLMPMYLRVARAIRDAGSAQMVVLETTMGSNMGVYSAIEPLVLAGRQDPAQVYAPHGYDLVVDTPDIAQASPERVELIFKRHGETAQRLDMPMLVGEWGAYGSSPGTLSAAWHVVHQFEALLCSETYWAYEPGVEHFPCFRAIQRPYAERVAGTLLGHHYNPDTRVFEASWQEDGQITAPSLIYLPDWFTYEEAELELTPTGSGCRTSPISAGSHNRHLAIAPTGEPCTRHLVLKQGAL